MMLAGFSIHTIDIILIIALAAIFTLIILKIIKDKKAGKSSCGCNCSGCANTCRCGQNKK